MIVGAGPVGLMFACELSLHGVQGTVVLDPLPGPNPEPRANGVGGPAVRLLDHRGLYEQLTGSSQPPSPSPTSTFAALSFPVEVAASTQNYLMPLQQPVLNRALAERADDLGIDVRWGHRLVGFTAGRDGVTADIDGPTGRYTMNAGYVIGADGGRGITRKLAGIDYVGMSSRDSVFRMGRGLTPAPGWAEKVTGHAQIPGTQLQRAPFVRTETGMFFLITNPHLSMVGTLELAPSADDTYVPGREHPGFGDQLTMAELRDSIRRVLGFDLPMHPVRTDDDVDLRTYAGINTLIAERYRQDRVLLVGDAAHVQSAMGGPGLNLGLQDAANLAWKLAAVVRGDMTPELLDTYETERRIAAECAITVSRAQFALMRPGPEVTALCQVMGDLATQPAAAQRLAELVSLSDIRYPTTPGDHPAVGKWVPDLPISTTDPTVTRIAQLTHDGRPLLLDFTGNGTIAEAAADAGNTIQVVRATASEPTGLTAILIRPDGYVAWASSDPAPNVPSLDRTLRQWLGIALNADRGGNDHAPSAS